ncbi:dihydrofolate reductase family protein [Bradyrhizobium sp. 195]|uniref:dihydrofolate reductase family protein n=1 Tax=Bradyrhizobium sp. 195 TaxID=2782662 RepID=UPI0020009F43|nr:dihydrofolate reductase family protein [Bradyrhizobium sp. 195]UPK31078.1 dihydrofolate reductase family protein [Bradyrhizobium sp. 195]
MGKVRTSAFSVSIDGFGAALNQSLDNPFGEGGMALPGWMLKTRMFHSMRGQEGGSTGVDDGFASRSMENIGVWIMGRNMFGPVRGPWPDDTWKGWWGPNPPYHTPVYVLTHHGRAPIEMEGGTIFHFVTDGIESALTQARLAAKDRDIRVGGGTSVVRQFLQSRLLDEINLALPAVLLGAGESLFASLDLPALGYAPIARVAGENATHITIARTPA